MELTRKEYVEQRKALVAEAEAYAKEGSRDKFDATKVKIEELDKAYEQAARARANARAMEAELTKIRNAVPERGNAPALASVVGGRVIDTTGEGDVRAFGARLAGWKPSAERGKQLKAMNAVQLTSEGIVSPTRYSNELSPGWNEVSSLIDRVRIFPRLGGESFVQAYIRGYGEGQEIADDANYHETDPEFGHVAINKVKVTAYSEEDEGVLKLPDVDYDAEVARNIRIALRKRLTREILVGPGTANRLRGIFNSTYDQARPDEGAIDPDTDLAIAAIDDGTLDEIIFSYGGEEDVEDGAVLILHKADLKAFAKLRDGKGNRVHTIRAMGNTGFIDGVPYILNGACTPLAQAQPGDYTMAYGYPTSYGLAIFSDVDVQRSTDYKFRSGQVAHRGSVYVGGNVIRWNGFLRVKKGEEV